MFHRSPQRSDWHTSHMSHPCSQRCWGTAGGNPKDPACQYQWIGQYFNTKIRANHDHVGHFNTFDNKVQHQAHSLAYSACNGCVTSTLPTLSKALWLWIWARTQFLLSGNTWNPLFSEEIWPQLQNRVYFISFEKPSLVKVYFALIENLIFARFPYYLPNLSEAFTFSLWCSKYRKPKYSEYI